MKKDFKRENSLKKKKDGDEIVHEQMLKSYQIASDDEKKAHAKEEKDKD
ncbi:hypothetical protein HUG20_15300 [Salicibibacter cibi]|uniref:YfhE family protein n=1 Tax=Salicibibacter cibi TaxID=2743001 RepID=A0A7T6ZCR1_9BACI|nr:hypothetical protein [Salicibibacter cibi]QQK81128.1 hypothetical protein HUG20_15300 [Salicibibacter cibi]